MSEKPETVFITPDGLKQANYAGLISHRAYLDMLAARLAAIRTAEEKWRVGFRPAASPLSTETH